MVQDTIRVIASTEEVDLIEAMARGLGADVQRLETRALDPGTVTLVLVGSIAVLAAAQAAIENYRGGQVIDLRPEAATPFYRSRGLHYGLIAVVASDGAIRVTTVDPKDMFDRVVSLLQSALVPGQPVGVLEAEKQVRAALSAVSGVDIESALDRN